MIKENINKIDYELKNLFEEVEISEKNNRNGYYFEINASSHINFDDVRKKVSVKVDIKKPDLMANNISWSYYTNPSNESSEVINRVSNINNISSDIYRIVSKKMMEEEYFESLSPVEEFINESVITLDQREELEQKLEDIFKVFQIESKPIEESKYFSNGDKPEKTLTYYKELKASDMFLLESQLNSIGIEYVSFHNGSIKIKF